MELDMARGNWERHWKENSSLAESENREYSKSGNSAVTTQTSHTGVLQGAEHICSHVLMVKETHHQ